MTPHIRTAAQSRSFLQCTLLLAGATTLNLSGIGAISSPTIAAPAQQNSAPSPYSYAQAADLAQGAPAILIGKVRSVAPVRQERAAGLRPGTARYYLAVQATTLIRGEGGLSPRLGMVIDLPEPSSRTQARALKGKTFLFFGKAAAGGMQFQLLDSDALLPWTPAVEAQIRSIASELVAADAPPAVRGVVDAFHVRGTVAGESETQIFLATTTGRPVSLSVIRRPGQAPHFGAALGEIIDEAASVPPRDTLLWYRLACGLPATLPAVAMTKLDPADGGAASADYAAFLDQLGGCNRGVRPPLLGKAVP